MVGAYDRRSRGRLLCQGLPVIVFVVERSTQSVSVVYAAVPSVGPASVLSPSVFAEKIGHDPRLPLSIVIRRVARPISPRFPSPHPRSRYSTRIQPLRPGGFDSSNQVGERRFVFPKPRCCAGLTLRVRARDDTRSSSSKARLKICCDACARRESVASLPPLLFALWARRVAGRRCATLRLASVFCALIGRCLLLPWKRGESFWTRALVPWKGKENLN